jgi:protein involved in polysaccharide export with SLBB domain
MNQNSTLMRCAIILLSLLCAETMESAEVATTPGQSSSTGQTNLFLSVHNSKSRAAWQQHMTLGPGDTLTISIYDVADTRRLEVPVGPDGRITYLQARDVKAAGLTIDELRTKLDQELNRFYQNPRTVILPVAYRSKKYVVLGAVQNKGVYPLERPVTIIEAIARAGGLETGLYDQRSVELADLSRSFLARNGKRVPVDFERLFQKGDLTQNAALEPEDYLYFASASANEIYVLGEVAGPGVLLFSPKPTVVTAIASRGGFTTRAFKSRVLIVRGSLTHPKTFVIDTAAILNGKAPDFPLQAHDIVYIGTNPWVVAAEVLDIAARAFVQSMIVETATLHIPAAIK